MLIAYELHMQPSSTTPHPSRSWREKRYIIVRRYGKKAATPELRTYWFSWSDGWSCWIKAREVDSAEARRLRRASAGFAGYDWMVTSIEQHGQIQFPERKQA